MGSYKDDLYRRAKDGDFGAQYELDWLRARDDEYRSQSTGGQAGTSPGPLAIPFAVGVGLMLLTGWLNHILPFWLRCLIALGAAFYAAKWSGDKVHWIIFDGRQAPVITSILVAVRVLVFALVAVPMLALFYDHDQLGSRTVEAYEITTYVGLGLLVVVGLIFEWCKGYFESLRQNPIGVGCTTLFVGWVLWSLILAAVGSATYMARPVVTHAAIQHHHKR